MIIFVECLIVFLVLFGIFLLSKVKLAKAGNIISGIGILLAVILTLTRIKPGLLNYLFLFLSLAVGLVIGIIIGYKVKMIDMPQTVAMLNGFGGLTSTVVGWFTFIGSGNNFQKITAGLALIIGIITFIGSIVAALKLHKVISQKPIALKGHHFYTVTSLVLLFVFFVLAIIDLGGIRLLYIILTALFTVCFSIFFSIRVGGADMPIAISLLNSLSGVAGGIAGIAMGDVLLVIIGAVVGASGLFLTIIMCRAINRKLKDIMLGKTSVRRKETKESVADNSVATDIGSAVDVALHAKNVIIVPGYGMALAQAQMLVKELADILAEKGAAVKYAIHPVAGRMPGHMNVLLCEANVDYEDLYEMKDINSEFKDADLTIVVGANDVINPAAREEEGTPIYGMPVLAVDQCPNIFIFNYDMRPGYAGVNNPLYQRKAGIWLFLGDAKETLKNFIAKLDS